MTNIWTPVQPGDYGALSVYNGGKTLEMPEETCDLPDDVRLCERVPDEPITPEVLQQEEWHQQAYGGRATAYMKAGLIVHDDPTLTNLLVTWRGQEIENCRTMQQLAALVEMLGGQP